MVEHNTSWLEVWRVFHEDDGCIIFIYMQETFHLITLKGLISFHNDKSPLYDIVLHFLHGHSWLLVLWVLIGTSSSSAIHKNDNSPTSGLPILDRACTSNVNGPEWRPLRGRYIRGCDILLQLSDGRWMWTDGSPFISMNVTHYCALRRATYSKWTGGHAPQRPRNWTCAFFWQCSALHCYAEHLRWQGALGYQ